MPALSNVCLFWCFRKFLSFFGGDAAAICLIRWISRFCGFTHPCKHIPTDHNTIDQQRSQLDHLSGQIVSDRKHEFWPPPKCSEERRKVFFYFDGKLAWWNILIWPDLCHGRCCGLFNRASCFVQEKACQRTVISWTPNLSLITVRSF